MTLPSWPTVKEAAAQMGVSIQYVTRMISEGRIHAVMRGDVWMIDPESLRQFKERRDSKRQQQQTE